MGASFIHLSRHRRRLCRSCFPQPEDLSHDKELVAKLSPQSKSLLVPEDKEGWQSANDWGTDVAMPNGSCLSFRKGVPEKDMAAASKEYWELISTTTNERSWSLIGFGALWWLVPSIAIYVFGWGVGWGLSWIPKQVARSL
ncbi:MAG: hypothetical protein KGI54_08215 [Pseudomonadota bacterium]|nr:hypothetical protein [Pseudomonadota bacterium]